MENKTLIFGHRGSAGTHPENTMISFEAALKAGAEGIEVDVQLTKDLVPVIIHDERVDRTTNGSGWVKDLTLAQIQQLDAGSKFDPAFSNVTIPTLEELLKWTANTPLFLNIEIKNEFVRYLGIEQQILELVQKYHLLNRVIISSFNHYSLVEVRKLNREIETAILFMEGIFEPWNYARSIGANALHCYLPVAVPELFVGAAQAQMPVRVFTVNEKNDMIYLFNHRCSAIFTDWPQKAVEIRNSLV